MAHKIPAAGLTSGAISATINGLTRDAVTAFHPAQPTPAKQEPFMSDPNSASQAHPDSSLPPRRNFVAASAITSLAAGLHTDASAASVRSPQERVVVGVMGLQRGMALARTFAATPGVEVKYLCEADSNRLNAAKKVFDGLVDYDFLTTGNFRDILDDPDVDALVCAAPNHWHAPAAILACNAGKHCYVEKPCSHNPWEGKRWLLPQENTSGVCRWAARDAAGKKSLKP